mmetsp:Transcript_95910/g.222346  ORF Transcript_95910/g.222346 Transcript_95910/m.222346 type:complete len:280 (+) Transcript_95910:354-1193(+)
MVDLEALVGLYEVEPHLVHRQEQCARPLSILRIVDAHQGLQAFPLPPSKNSHQGLQPRPTLPPRGEHDHHIRVRDQDPSGHGDESSAGDGILPLRLGTQADAQKLCESPGLVLLCVSPVRGQEHDVLQECVFSKRRKGLDYPHAEVRGHECLTSGGHEVAGKKPHHRDLAAREVVSRAAVLDADDLAQRQLALKVLQKQATVRKGEAHVLELDVVLVLHAVEVWHVVVLACLQALLVRRFLRWAVQQLGDAVQGQRCILSPHEDDEGLRQRLPEAQVVA